MLHIKGEIDLWDIETGEYKTVFTIAEGSNLGKLSSMIPLSDNIVILPTLANLPINPYDLSPNDLDPFSTVAPATLIKLSYNF